MEREAFARAWRFLNFKPVAKWSALAAGVTSGVLYVAFLIILGMYADLMVNRGRLPGFSDLTVREQQAFLQNWAIMPQEQFLEKWSSMTVEERQQRLQEEVVPDKDAAARLAAIDPGQLTPEQKELVWRSYLSPLLRDQQQRLQAVGVDEQKARELAATMDPAALPLSDKRLLWRTHLYQVLNNQVGEAAARVVTEGDQAEDLSDHGILSLVVRSHDKFYGPLVSAAARWSPALWRGANGSSYFANYLTALLMVGIALALLRGVAMFGMNYAAALATVEASNRLRRALYHHTYRLGTLAFRALGPGEAVGIFTRQVETVHNGLYVCLTVLSCEPVKLVLLVAFALAVNFWLALAFLIFSLLVWLVGGQVATFFRRQERVATNESAEHLALLQESLMMMRLVKCYLMELFNQSRVERQLTVHAAAQMRRYRGEAIYRPLLISLGTLIALVLLYVAGRVILSGGLSVASVIILATALLSLYLPLVAWLEQRRLLRRAREAAVILFKFLDRRGDVGQVIGAEFLPPLGEELEFDNVSLKEPGTGRKLLQGVALTIRAGQRVALVGPENMEKHALIYLLPRFLDPESGEIHIDGRDVRWVTIDSLRAEIGIVLQHNLVFNDTVANNIGCGDASYTLPKIIEASKVAHAHQFIQKLPKGYETVVGEMGHYLSTSEQFRIALARAVLRDPALLIIEEPVAPLDDDSKSLIDDTFARVLPGRTVIFLPHRLSTIRSCDQVYLLHKGKIEAAGEHRELLAHNNLYRHLQYIEFNEFAEQV